MLNAARAHGRPMMVIAMMIAATSQPKAIQAPPNRIQMTLRRIETGCMRSPACASRHAFYQARTAKAIAGAAIHAERRDDAPDFRPFNRATSASMVSAEMTQFLPRRFAA